MPITFSEIHLGKGKSYDMTPSAYVERLMAMDLLSSKIIYSLVLHVRISSVIKADYISLVAILASDLLCCSNVRTHRVYL